MDRENDRDHNRGAENREADDVLPAVGNRALRENFLEFSGGDQAACKGQRADDHFHCNLDHAEFRDVRRMHVVLGDTDHGCGQSAERMAKGGSLRHGRHADHAERDADGGADDQRDGDPLVLDKGGIEKCRGDGKCRANFAGDHSMTCGGRRAEPLQRENEEDGCDDVGEVDELTNGNRIHDFLGFPVLNMRSMRSVIRKPPTMLLNEAATAMVPSMVVSLVSCRPAMMMAATTTMASRAFVSDISGVCSSGETRLINSNPTKPARMNTKRFEIKSAGTRSSFYGACL